MKRQKYSNGSSVVVSKNFKSIGDTNTNISSSFSGNRKNLNKAVNVNLSSPSNKINIGASRNLNNNNTSVFGSYRPNKNTEIKYRQNGKNRSLTFIRRF